MIKGMTLTKGGNKLPLILGVVLGLVAAVLVVVYLSSASDDGGSGSSTSGAGVPVVVAANDIAANTRLTPEMLTTKNVAESDRLVGAFQSLEGLAGQVTKVPLLKDEQVVQSKVINSITAGEFGGDPPLVFTIDAGMRGVSVSVSSLIGAGGNIRPGDFVDVILIVEVKPVGADVQTTGTDQISTTILQNVKVLAVDQEVTNPNAETSTDPDESKEANEAATSVTLQVTPAQAEALAMADVCGENHGGRLSLSLRGAGDTAPISNRPGYTGGDNPTCSALLGIDELGG